MTIRWAGDGRHTLLVLPGVPGQPADWYPLADRLAARHRVGVVDLVGFGRDARVASPSELGFPAQAAALATALDADGVHGAAVLGHDIGGPVAVLLAAARPDLVTTLAVASCNVLADPRLAAPMRALAVPWLRRLAAAALFSRPSLAAMSRTTGGAPRPGRNSSVERSNIATLFTEALSDPGATFRPVQEAVTSLGQPVRFWFGDHDPFFDVAQARRTAALRPDHALRLFPGAGHYLHLEAPGLLEQEVESLATSRGRR